MHISIRKLTENDCYDLWVWRNQPQVRKWCLNSEAIDYAEHKRWFKAKFNNQDVKMYVAEIEDAQKIGQVRFDKDTDQGWYINVNLNPQFLGRGLGSKIIRIASDCFFNEENHASEIIAQIKEKNQASLKAFGKAGFVYFGQLRNDKGNIKILTYSR